MPREIAAQRNSWWKLKLVILIRKVILSYLPPDALMGDKIRKCGLTDRKTYQLLYMRIVISFSTCSNKKTIKQIKKEKEKVKRAQMNIYLSTCLRSRFSKERGPPSDGIRENEVSLSPSPPDWKEGSPRGSIPLSKIPSSGALTEVSGSPSGGGSPPGVWAGSRFSVRLSLDWMNRVLPDYTYASSSRLSERSLHHVSRNGGSSPRTEDGREKRARAKFRHHSITVRVSRDQGGTRTMVQLTAAELL